jgi:hypothetical protein
MRTRCGLAGITVSPEPNHINVSEKWRCGLAGITVSPELVDATRLVGLAGIMVRLEHAARGNERTWGAD